MTARYIIFAILNTRYGTATAQAFNSNPFDQWNEKDLSHIEAVCTELLDTQILCREAHYEVSKYLTSLRKQAGTKK